MSIVKRLDWSEYFLNIAEAIAKRSPDMKTQVGCLIVSQDKRIISTGYNGTPPGFDDSGINWFTDEKHPVIIHAEMNAILWAAGSPLQNATLYCTYSPCTECAKNIAAARIKSVVYRKKYTDEGLRILAQFGITATKIEE